MLSPALLNCPGTWAHFLHVHIGVQPASACGISLAVERPGGACEMKSPVLVAVAEHYSLWGGLMWLGKQMMENASVLKLFQGTEGNRPESFLF